jgi:type II secretion system protein N
MKRLLIASAVAAALIVGLWLIAIPETLLLEKIKDTFRGEKLSVTIDGFSKGFFYHCTARKVTLVSSGTALLSIDNLNAGVNPLALIIMRLPLYFDGGIAGGMMNGDFDLLSGGDRMTAGVFNANIQGIDFFSVLGLSGQGLLTGNFAYLKGKGHANFFIRDMRLDNKPFLGISLPLDAFGIMRGAIEVNAGGVDITSLSLEGKSIFARVKGRVGGGMVDLAMEIMPDPAFNDKDNLLMLLASYRKSPGYYIVPIKGPLSF